MSLSDQYPGLAKVTQEFVGKVTKRITGVPDLIVKQMLVLSLLWCLNDGFVTEFVFLTCVALTKSIYYKPVEKHVSRIVKKMTSLVIHRAMHNSFWFGQHVISAAVIVEQPNRKPGKETWRIARLNYDNLKPCHLFKTNSPGVREVVKRCKLFRKDRMAVDEHNCLHWFAEIEKSVNPEVYGFYQVVRDISQQLLATYSKSGGTWIYTYQMEWDDKYIWIHPSNIGSDYFTFKIPDMELRYAAGVDHLKVSDVQPRVVTRMELEWKELFTKFEGERTILRSDGNECELCNKSVEQLHKHLRDTHDCRSLMNHYFVKDKLSPWELGSRFTNEFVDGMCRLLVLDGRAEIAALMYSGFDVVTAMQRLGELLLSSKIAEAMRCLSCRVQTFYHMMMSPMTSVKYVSDYLRLCMRMKDRTCTNMYGVNTQKEMALLGDKHLTNMFRGALALHSMKDEIACAEFIRFYLNYAVHRVYNDVKGHDVTLRPEPVMGASSYLAKICAANINDLVLPGPTYFCWIMAEGQKCKMCIDLGWVLER